MQDDTVHVRGIAKRRVNEHIALALTKSERYRRVKCTRYSASGAKNFNLLIMPHGTAVAIFNKFKDGYPYAIATGTWDAENMRIK